MADDTPSEDELLTALKGIQFSNPIMNAASAIISLSKYHKWSLDENTVRAVILKYTITDWSPEPEREEDQRVEESPDTRLRTLQPSLEQSAFRQDDVKHVQKSRKSEKEAEKISDSQLPRSAQRYSQRQDPWQEGEDEAYWSSPEISKDGADKFWEPRSMDQSLEQTLRDTKEEITEDWISAQRKQDTEANPGQHELILAIKKLQSQHPTLVGSQAHRRICEQYHWTIGEKRYQDNECIVSRLNWLKKESDHEETPTDPNSRNDKRNLNENELVAVIQKMRSRLPTIKGYEALIYLWFWDNLKVNANQFYVSLSKVDRDDKLIAAEEAPILSKNMNGLDQADKLSGQRKPPISPHNVERFDKVNKPIRKENSPTFPVNVQKLHEVDKPVEKMKAGINTNDKPDPQSPEHDVLMAAIQKLRSEQPGAKGKEARKHLQKQYNWCFSTRMFEDIVDHLDRADKHSNQKEPTQEDVLSSFRELKDQQPYWNKEKIFDVLRSKNAWILSFTRFRDILNGSDLSRRSQLVEEAGNPLLEECQAGDQAERLVNREETPKILDFKPNSVKSQQIEGIASTSMLHARPLSLNEKTLLQILNKAGTKQELAQNPNRRGTATFEANKELVQTREKTGLTGSEGKELSTEILYRGDGNTPVTQGEVAQVLEETALITPEVQAKEMKLSHESMANDLASAKEVVEKDLHPPYPRNKPGRSRLPQPTNKRRGSIPRSSSTASARGKGGDLLRRAITNSVAKMEVVGNGVKAAANVLQKSDAPDSSKLESKIVRLPKVAEQKEVAVTKKTQPFEVEVEKPQTSSVNEGLKPDRNLELVSESSQPLLMERNEIKPSTRVENVESEITAELGFQEAHLVSKEHNTENRKFLKLYGKEYDFGVQPVSEMNKLLKKQYEFIKNQLRSYGGKPMPKSEKNALVSSQDLQGLWQFYKLSGEKLQIEKDDLAKQFQDEWMINPIKGEGNDDNDEELIKFKEEYKRRKIDELRCKEALHPGSIVFHMDEKGSWNPKFDEEKDGLTSIMAWQYKKDGTIIGRVL